MFHPVHTFISKFVTNFEAKDLHVKVIEDGHVIYTNPTLNEMRELRKRKFRFIMG